MKHTKAPWSYQHVYGKTYSVQCAGGQYHIGTVRAKENARLIAAAPELLEAAQMVLSNKRGEDDWLIPAVHCQALAAAIKKATGGAP